MQSVGKGGEDGKHKVKSGISSPSDVTDTLRNTKATMYKLATVACEETIKGGFEEEMGDASACMIAYAWNLEES
ncbi:hypothetical protein TNCV_5060751 [Trichonephila clavipes]|nr:hypothetical protein TNCV_5060751 [Trichonephila clavipes]